MLPITINPLPLIFTVATAFGVLVHDTQIDRAATTFIAVPAAFASFAAADSVIKSSEHHVHVERASVPRVVNFQATTPRVQPRDDDRQYIQSRKLSFGTTNGSYLWPSV